MVVSMLASILIAHAASILECLVPSMVVSMLASILIIHASRSHYLCRHRFDTGPCFDAARLDDEVRVDAYFACFKDDECSLRCCSHGVLEHCTLTCTIWCLVASPLAHDTGVDTWVLSRVDARFEKSNAVLLLPFVTQVLGRFNTCRHTRFDPWVLRRFVDTARRHFAAWMLGCLITSMLASSRVLLASRMRIARFDAARFNCSNAAVFRSCMPQRYNQLALADCWCRTWWWWIRHRRTTQNAKLWCVGHPKNPGMTPPPMGASHPL